MEAPVMHISIINIITNRIWGMAIIKKSEVAADFLVEAVFSAVNPSIH